MMILIIMHQILYGGSLSHKRLETALIYSAAQTFVSQERFATRWPKIRSDLPHGGGGVHVKTTKPPTVRQHLNKVKTSSLLIELPASTFTLWNK